MTEHHKDLIENFDKYVIGVDDTFHFKCRGCGKCCKNREDIILTPRDLFNIAKKLGMTTEAVMGKYCDRYIGGSSRIPIVRLQPRGVNNACPLLVDKRCLVHDGPKPVICALFPLGRVKMNKNFREDGITPDVPTETSYVFMDPSCGSYNRKYTVRGWLEKFGIPVEDELYDKWNELVMYLSFFILKLEEMKVSEKILNPFWQLMGVLLYSRYDTDKEFMPQFEENASMLKTDLDKLLTAYESALRELQEGNSDEE